MSQDAVLAIAIVECRFGTKKSREMAVFKSCLLVEVQLLSINFDCKPKL